jgi:phosphatidylserine decarboxylase|tara:strand:+ start:240 stop:866 length:627 start_codon:yes stop_codon:yes gene_type:complete
MKIHKEGYKIIRNFIIISLTILLFFPYFYLSFILLSTLLLIVYFFRVPNRKIKTSKNVVFAPCDGKIVQIREVEETEFFKQKKILVSIFMSPLNVHSNHYPIDGNVVYTKYHPGKFLVAWNPKSSTKNERSSVVIENTKISVLVRQIAGALARRIVTYSKRNEQVTSGEELGFIKFGSRVDLYLPLSTEINVKLNEKVKAKISIIAKY